jgi:threonine dehydrogenase-like Zn-dependent dehydrogenase
VSAESRADVSRAAVLVEPERLELAEFPLPEVGDDDGLLRVEATGICGSDYAQFQGRLSAFDAPMPIIPGHEVVGRVHELGPGAAHRWRVRPGDLVVVDEVLRCLRCRACAMGERGCAAMRLYGLTITTAEVPSLWGGYAEYMYLHANTVLHRVPEGVSADEAAAFVPIANGIRWMSHLGAVGVGDTVVIQGPGQQGLGCVIGAREAGARTVIVSGTAADADRLAVARDFGADTTIVADVDEPIEAVRAATKGHLADVVIDASAEATAPVRDSLDMVRAGGTVLLAGLKSNEPIPGFVSDKVVLRQLTVRGVGGHDARSIRAALSVIAGRRYPTERMHTHRFRLAEAEKAVRSVGREVAGDTPIHATITP